jgi:ubiquinone/menaquinone biosynthesis C-methylase UbiE
MLLRASFNLDRAGVETRLHLCDAKDLAFEDGTFDAVIGAHVLEHLDGSFGGLSEIVRVLKSATRGRSNHARHARQQRRIARQVVRGE